jgi:coproporphyrinogen III oxidase-like Fe-S oxidoreductase
MLHEPLSWLKKAQEIGAGIQKMEKISSVELLEELILMGLRLPQGIDDQIFQTHFKRNIAQIFDAKKLQMLANQGLIEVTIDSIKIPNHARLLTNSIITKVCEALI